MAAQTSQDRTRAKKTTGDVRKRSVYHRSDDEHDSGTGTEEERRRWCDCRKTEYGKMVACENEECVKQWFHLSCVGLTSKTVPPDPIPWFCADCRLERNVDAFGNIDLQKSLNEEQLQSYTELKPDQKAVTKVDNAVEIKVVDAVGPRSHYPVLNAEKSPIARVEEVDGFKITGEYAIFYRYRFKEADVGKNNQEAQTDDREDPQEVSGVQEADGETQQKGEEDQQEEKKGRAEGVKTSKVQESNTTGKPQQRRQSKAEETLTERRDSMAEAKIKHEGENEKGAKKGQEEAKVAEPEETRKSPLKLEI